MRDLLLLVIGCTLVLINYPSYAKPLHVKCYSGSHVIYDKYLTDDQVRVYPDGSIIAYSKHKSELIMGDCIVSLTK